MSATSFIINYGGRWENDNYVGGEKRFVLVPEYGLTYCRLLSKIQGMVRVEQDRFVYIIKSVVELLDGDSARMDIRNDFELNFVMNRFKLPTFFVTVGQAEPEHFSQFGYPRIVQVQPSYMNAQNASSLPPSVPPEAGNDSISGVKIIDGVGNQESNEVVLHDCGDDVVCRDDRRSGCDDIDFHELDEHNSLDDVGDMKHGGDQCDVDGIGRRNAVTNDVDVDVMPAGFHELNEHNILDDVGHMKNGGDQCDVDGIGRRNTVTNVDVDVDANIMLAEKAQFRPWIVPGALYHASLPFDDSEPYEQYRSVPHGTLADGAFFDDKESLKVALGQHHLLNGGEYSVERSSKKRFSVVCKYKEQCQFLDLQQHANKSGLQPKSCGKVCSRRDNCIRHSHDKMVEVITTATARRPRPRRCNICHGAGHNCRKCPSRVNATN